MCLSSAKPIPVSWCGNWAILPRRKRRMQRSLMSHYQSNERFGEPDLPSKVGFFENQQNHVPHGELADRSVKLLSAKHLTVRHGVAELAHLATCPPVELRNKPVDRLAEIDMMRP